MKHYCDSLYGRNHDLASLYGILVTTDIFHLPQSCPSFHISRITCTTECDFLRMFNTSIPMVSHAKQGLPTILQHSSTPSFFSCSRCSSFSFLCNAWQRCSVRLYPQLLIRKAQVLLCCLCLFVHSDVQQFFPTIRLYVFCSVLWCSLRFLHKNEVRFVFTTVDCRRAHFLFMLFVFVCVSWCPARIDYTSHMVGIFWETGYA